MDIFNKEKIASLESELEIYKARCNRLELDAKSVKDLELKVKCLQMWCDDDEAIDEILTAVKSNEQGQRNLNVRAAAARASSNGFGAGALGQASCFGLVSGSY